MNYLYYITFACCLGLCYSIDGGWLYELRKGRCSGEKLADEDIVKPGAPYTTKTTTVSIHSILLIFIC